MSVTELIQKQIGDLLPNEQILNFHEGVSKLPDWLGDNLKLIMGAGDLDQIGMSNVLQFYMFDVFFCQPWTSRNSLRQNVVDLLHYFPKKKVICFINQENKKEMDQFCSLFKNRFSLVDGYEGHCPHFSLDQLSIILKAGGTAVNIYENHHLLVDDNGLLTVLSKSTNALTPKDNNVLLGTFRLANYTNETLKKEIVIDYSYRLIYHIENKLQSLKNLSVDWSILSKDDYMLNLRVLSTILGVLVMFDPMFNGPFPPTLRGVFKNNTRIWNGDRIYKELVITKVQEGGSRRKGKRKMTRKRASTKAKARH
jgi:hypothetical protein